MTRTVAFTPVSFIEYNEWFDTDKQVVERIKLLVRKIDRDPFKGIGKPEPLKNEWSGYWSRRINHEYRLIY